MRFAATKGRRCQCNVSVQVAHWSHLPLSAVDFRAVRLLDIYIIDFGLASSRVLVPTAIFFIIIFDKGLNISPTAEKSHGDRIDRRRPT